MKTNVRRNEFLSAERVDERRERDVESEVEDAERSSFICKTNLNNKSKNMHFEFILKALLAVSQHFYASSNPL